MIDNISDRHLFDANYIMSRTCQDQGVKLKDVLGKGRWHFLVLVRVLIAVRLRNIGLNYSQIGRLMNRDHSTVMELCGYRQERRKK